jgi:para-aminobenzoate synthetase component 1
LGDILSNEILIELDYKPSLQTFYQKLCDLPGFVLLESTDHHRGRYDILSALPYERCIMTEDTPDKWTALNDLKQHLPVRSSRYSLPFQGGALGYIAYDLGARLHGIQSVAQSTLSDMPLLNLGIYDWAIIVDHHLEKVSLFAAHNHPSTSEITQKIIELWKKTNNENKKYTLEDNFTPLILKEEYEASFGEIYKALQAGRSYQVNLTQPFNCSYKGDAWQIYKKISSKNPVPFSAYLHMAEADILSFSPERFLLHDAGTLLTSPIKGTIGRSLDPKKDEQLKNQLRLSSKDHAENTMIVDLLRNDLGKIAKSGTVKVLNLCDIQSFKSVHHLVSDIEAEALEHLHPFDLFISCFPGGSITGAPKLESMRIINEQERYGRSVYCGSIGYFSHHGRFDTNIAIRTIIAKANKLHVSAGGGIVIDSHFEDEYRECYTKIEAIINALK